MNKKKQKVKWVEATNPMKDCCEKHIRNVHGKYPDLVYGQCDCPTCGHPWGFTFSDTIDKDIENLESNEKR